jgi:FMN reductase
MSLLPAHDSSTPSAATAPAAADPPLRIVVLIGNPRAGSRTSALARTLGQELAQTHGVPFRTLELSELTDQLGAPLGAGSAQRWAGPLATLAEADLLIVATPVYKGSYTGLLKAFLDHVGGGALHRTVAVPVITVGSPAHTLAADLHLRPLLLELGASTPTEALVVGNDRIDAPDAATSSWLERNGERLHRALAPAPVAAGSRS